MLKRMLAMGLTVGVAFGILTSCGDSSSKKSPQQGKGALITLIGDVPLCDVLSFRMSVTSMKLTPQGGGSALEVLPTASTFRLNLGTLRDSSTILNLASVTEGTYDEVTLGLSVPQLGVYDSSQSPPSEVITSQFETGTPTASIQPPLIVSKDKVSALRIDFDMLRSIELDANGQVTGKVTPVFTLTAVNPSESQNLAEFDDLVGFVRSVSTSSTNPDFIGGFLMQLLSASVPAGPAVNVNLLPDCTAQPTKCTQMFGTPALNELLTGSFMELEGFVDSKGNLVATTVEVEDREDATQNKVALIGLVTSLTKGSNGNLTQFGLWVRQEEPDASMVIGGTTVPLDSIVAVNVSSSTTYQFSSRTTNFANLVFDPTALAVGQEVVVHGPYTKLEDQSVTVAAEKVYLKLQPFQGRFASLVQVGSDDKTGAFQLAPCCTLLQGTPIYVLTNNETAFVNLSGLSALSPQPTLLVRGLPFLQPQGGTINGVPVPAGTLVMLAKQVHQLQ